MHILTAINDALCKFPHIVVVLGFYVLMESNVYTNFNDFNPPESLRL